MDIKSTSTEPFSIPRQSDIKSVREQNGTFKNHAAYRVLEGYASIRRTELQKREEQTLNANDHEQFVVTHQSMDIETMVLDRKTMAPKDKDRIFRTRTHAELKKVHAAASTLPAESFLRTLTQAERVAATSDIEPTATLSDTSVPSETQNYAHTGTSGSIPHTRYSILRAPPLLANGVDLLEETKKLIAGTDILPTANNLILTSYGFGKEVTHLKIAKNLILDINCCFEEELQKVLENDSHFVESAKKIVDVIHSKLFSVDEFENGEDSGVAARTKRDKYIIDQLCNYYSESELSNFLEDKDCWLDTKFREFSVKKFSGLKDKLISDGDQRATAVAYLKLLKMLRTQVPYFGGSVEYNRNITGSLEFWLYHLSTLTKDPNRQFMLSDEKNRGSLSKPLKDYVTNRTGSIPFMNQRNLGTGVIETNWKDLPSEFKEKITAGLKEFEIHTGWYGSTRNPRNAEILWRACTQVIQKVNNFEKTPDLSTSQPVGLTAELRPPLSSHIIKTGEELPVFQKISQKSSANKPEVYFDFKLTPEQLWTHSDEDQRKAIYTDMCEVPWSDAHLISHDANWLNKSFSEGPYEVTFKKSILIAESKQEHTPRDVSEARYNKGERMLDRIIGRHPRDSGLINVAGLFGNILEKPAMAVEKYMKLEGHNVAINFEKFAEADLPGLPESKELIAEQFINSHSNWYANAFKNYKPIVGGMSGHTLGYMNLYSAAVSLLSNEQREQLPTMETLRAIMLAGLVGNKRHHSYDEVMAASTSVVTAREKDDTTYNFRDSYADLLRSSDDKIRQCAATALSNTKERYAKFLENSILSLLTLYSQAARPDPNTKKQIENVKLELAKLGKNVDDLQSVTESKLTQAESNKLKDQLDGHKENIEQLREKLTVFIKKEQANEKILKPYIDLRKTIQDYLNTWETAPSEDKRAGTHSSKVALSAGENDTNDEVNTCNGFLQTISQKIEAVLAVRANSGWR